ASSTRPDSSAPPAVTALIHAAPQLASPRALRASLGTSRALRPLRGPNDGEGAMLQITRELRSGGHTTLRLEGSMVAEGADLVGRECSALRRTGYVRIDLAGVGLVDRAGIDALARLDRAGVEIRCNPGTVASVLEAEGIRITTPHSRREAHP